VKKKGVWYLTPEGEEAIEMGPAKLLDSATRAYRKWRAEQPSDALPEADDTAANETSMAFEEVEQIAMSGFEQYIGDQNAYTICKYAGEGIIPAVRIGRVWRFDREEIDK